MLAATVFGLGMTAVSSKQADAALMLDWVVGEDGVLHDEAYRAMGTLFTERGDLLAF